MDCWEVLDIARFSDKKTIKIAYAKLLKLHRPDDNPEAFQQLHRAYKSALNWVPEEFDDSSAWMRLEDEPSDKALIEIVSESVAAQMLTEPALSDADQQLLDEIHTQEQLLSQDWQNLHARVSDIMRSENAINDVNEWKFLESFVSMNDLEFRKAASDLVFGVVAEANLSSLADKHLQIKRPVLNYLNNQFSWEKKWQEYQLVYSRKMLNAVYPYLEEAERSVKGISKKRELYFYRRGAAFAIDLAVLFVPILVYLSFKSILLALGLGNWFQSLEIQGELLSVIWVVVYLLVLIPIQESSLHQATIGKRLLELQVIDQQGDRISFFQSFWRSFVTVLCCIGIKIIVFVNFALSYWRSEVLQDTLSRSYVILRPRL